jgi:BMFP domain-containing protein YqiC
MTVTQAARDAAADYGKATHAVSTLERLAIRRGEWDDLPRVTKMAAILEQARAEAIEPLVGAIDAAMTDLDLLRRAIEERDPWAELLIRTTDTWRRLDSAIRSLSAAQEG